MNWQPFVLKLRQMADAGASLCLGAEADEWEDR